MRFFKTAQQAFETLHYGFGTWLLYASSKAVLFDNSKLPELTHEQRYEAAVTERALSMKGYVGKEFMFIMGGALIMRMQEDRLTPHDRTRARWSLALEQHNNERRTTRILPGCSR